MSTIPPLKKIGVVILNWNGKQDTLACMESLFCSSYQNFEVLLVDNCSSDGSVEAICRSYPKVTILQNSRNLGYAEGNNVGIRYFLQRICDYVFILNNDTVVAPDTIEQLVWVAESHPNPAIYSPLIYQYNNSNTIWFAGASWNRQRAVFLPHYSGEIDTGQIAEPIVSDYASGCALLVHAQVFRTVGLFDPRFFLTWEEADLCYRARRCGYRICIVPQAKVWHKISSSFEGGFLGTTMRYYYTRNRLLWIERNLTGREKVRAFLRCLKEVYWDIRTLSSDRTNIPERQLATTHLSAVKDYCLRRFGRFRQ